MQGYHANIEEVTIQNNNFREVLYTGKHSQLVVMSIKPGEEIGNEMHKLDQFFRVEKGKAKVVLNNGETVYEVEDQFAFIIPAGTWHNVINVGAEDLKVYTIYSPPEHQDKTVHTTKAEAQANEEHFDGVTTE